MANPFTEMRQAARDALNASFPGDSVFKYKQFFEDSNSMTPDDFAPTIGQLPALLVYPIPSEMPWIVHSAKEVNYSLAIEIWTRHWNLPKAEQIYWDVCRCLYSKSATDGGEPIIKAVTGQYPDVRAFHPEKGLLADENHAVKLSFTCVLKRVGVNPITGRF